MFYSSWANTDSTKRKELYLSKGKKVRNKNPNHTVWVFALQRLLTEPLHCLASETMSPPVQSKEWIFSFRFASPKEMFRL